jgi:hypothetical protein
MKDTKKNIRIANHMPAQQMKQLQKSMDGEGKEEESSSDDNDSVRGDNSQ